MLTFCTFVGFVLLVLIVIFILSSSSPTLKHRGIFHKYRIVENTLRNGEKRYSVEVNGFLGMPFLYQTDVENYGLYECTMRGMNFEEAKKYVEKRTLEYDKTSDSKVLKKKVVYQDKNYVQKAF